MAPENQTNTGSTLPQEVIEHARATPGEAFVHQGAIYLSTAAGEAILLASGSPGLDDATTRMGTSQDGKLVVFLREANPSELWVAETADGHQRRLLTEKPSDIPERNIAGIAKMQFSPDNRFLFFLVPAWATSHAVHVVDLRTLKERFVSDANCLLVIPSGRNRGRLFIERHRYKVFPGGNYGTYEWCGLVDKDGNEFKTLSLDETICPCDEYFLSSERRKIIDSVLGIRETVSARP